jgi:hypothetical protein
MKRETVLGTDIAQAFRSRGHVAPTKPELSDEARGGEASQVTGDQEMPSIDTTAGRPLTLARRLAAGRGPQPICSASSTIIPSGPRT